MSEQLLSEARPRRLLLATDLDSRGDRALDRAVQLARDWRAELHLVHVAEPQQALPRDVDQVSGIGEENFSTVFPDPHAATVRRIHRYVKHAGLPIKIHIEEGAPAGAILAVAEREACDLVILGESREVLLGLVESTLDQVVRKAPVSVLVVRERPHAAYRSLLVGTDFTDEALQAVVMAANVFPEARIELMHAYQMPYAGFLQNSPQTSAWIADKLKQLRAHLDQADLPRERKESISPLVAVGPPAAVLRRHVEEHDPDLTVIGAHPRGMLFDAMVGNSRPILSAIPGDILIVRASRRSAG